MISRLYIKNFRSIKELEVFPENLTALVGPNSTGKTNILKALDLIIGEGWTTKAKVARELFNDPKERLEIEVDFKTPVNYLDGYGRTIEASGITLVMCCYPSLSCDVRAQPGDRYLSEDFKKKCHFIFIPSQRDLADQMRVSGWTLLGKMMKEIHTNYISKYDGDEEKLKSDLKEIITPAKDFIEADFDSGKITYKKFVDLFKKYCDENSVGLANKFEPELNIYNLNWFYKTLQVQVTEHAGQIFDAEELGSGLQNLILISIFQTYAELMGGRVVFGIEEPEIYLYPQAQRALYESFQKLSEISQIFYTTHNPNFVKASRAHEIQILQKDNDRGTFILEKSPSITKEFLLEKKYQIYSHFNTHRNELFFAKKVLLLEGPSDKILFETLTKGLWGLDINKLGISIIDCSGKGGVIYFTAVCRLLDIDYFSVWDNDDEETPEILQKSLAEHKGLELSKNLEDFLSKYFPDIVFSSNDSKKIQQCNEWATNTSTYPKEFDLIKDFFCNDGSTHYTFDSIPEKSVPESDLPF
jgi:Predicted ATP-dependent endonuclease of the OLD family